MKSVTFKIKRTSLETEAAKHCHWKQQHLRLYYAVSIACATWGQQNVILSCCHMLLKFNISGVPLLRTYVDPNIGTK